MIIPVSDFTVMEDIAFTYMYSSVDSGTADYYERLNFDGLCQVCVIQPHLLKYLTESDNEFVYVSHYFPIVS